MNSCIQSIALVCVHYEAGANMGLEAQGIYQERESNRRWEKPSDRNAVLKPLQGVRGGRRIGWEESWSVHTSNNVSIKAMESPWAKAALGKIPTSHFNGPASVPQLRQETDTCSNHNSLTGDPYKAWLLPACRSYRAILPSVFIVSN